MKNCKMCRSEIDRKANICKYCSSDQRWYINILKNTGLINIVSVIVLVLSFIQFDNARKEKVLAQEASNSAQLALKNIDSLDLHFKRLVKLNAEISFIETNRYELHASGAIVHPQIFKIKLDSLMQLIESDKIKRQKWIEILNTSK